eukprot:gene46736-62523_t
MIRAKLAAATVSTERGASPFEALKSRWAVFGAIGIFIYVGSEVAIGSLMTNFLEAPNILSLSVSDAGRLVALYWAGALMGRFAGSALLTRIPAATLLIVFTTLAAILCAVVTQTGGATAAFAALAVGLFNSIMFPTIFSQTVIGLNAEDTPKAAALLCMGIVGGAILPLVTGFAADSVGLSVALIVPILGYAWLVFFGLFVHRQNTAPAS